jgi:hypothetical protein
MTVLNSAGRRRPRVPLEGKPFMSRTCRLLTIAGSLAAALLALLYRPAYGQYQPQVDAPHPDFVLPRIDNREAVSLAQFRGKKVLLIHFASW